MDWASFVGAVLLVVGALLVGAPRLAEASLIETLSRRAKSPTHLQAEMKTIFVVKPRPESNDEHLFGSIESAVAHGIIQAKELGESSFVLETRRTEIFQLSWIDGETPAPSGGV